MAGQSKSVIDIIIKATTTGFNNGIKTAETSLQKFGKGIKGVGASLNQYKVAILAASAAVAGIVLVVKKLTDAWIEEEKGIASLNAALTSHGYSIEKTKKQIDDYVAAQQRSTRFGDGETRKTIETLIDMNLGLEDAIKASTVAQDLAVAKGMDVVTAAELIGKAYNGNIGMLSRYGIVVDQAKYKSEGFGAVLDAMKGYSGRAAAEMDTLGGKIKQLKNYTEDVQEAIGKGLVLGMTNAISSSGDFTTSLERLVIKADAIGKWIAVYGIPGIKAYGTATWEVLRAVFTPGINVVMAFGTALSGVSKAMRFDIDGAKIAFRTATDLMKDIPGIVSKSWNIATKETDDYYKNAGKRAKEYDKISKVGATADTGARPGATGGDSAQTKDEKLQIELKKQQLELQKQLNDLRETGQLTEFKQTQVEQEHYRKLLETLKRDYPDAIDQIESVRGQLLDSIDAENKLREDALSKEIEGIKKADEERQTAHEKELKRLEDEAKALADWKAESEEQKASMKSDLYQSKEAEKRAGGRKGILTSIFRAALPGVAARADTKSEIADMKSAAAATAERANAMKKIDGELDVEAVKIQTLTTLYGNLQDAIMLARSEGKTERADALKQEQDEVIKEVIKLQGIETAKANRKKVDDEIKLQAEAQAKLAEQQYEEMHSAISNAISDGFEDGKNPLKSFVETLGAKLKKQLADNLATMIMGGGSGGGFMGGMTGGGSGGGGGGILGALGGLFGGGGGKGGAPTQFAAGWQSMASGIGDTSGAGAAASGGGGLLASTNPISAAIMAYSLYKSFSGNEVRPGLSGVQPIFDPVTMRSSGGTDALYGSDIFGTAAFSARNAGNALLKEGANIRRGFDVTVKASKEFDVDVEERNVGNSIKSKVRGTADRTNFENL